MADDFEKDWGALRPSIVADMSREELARFVLDLCDDRVFTSRHIPERHQRQMLPLVFLPLVFGGLEYIPERDHDKVGILWAYRSEALYLGVNGYPCFPSVRVMSKDDWERAHKAYMREMDRREKLAGSLFEGDDDADT